MPWIKLDDQWMDHPKIVRAGRDARDMWLASITWCAKHLTDGHFPPELLPALATMAGIDVANCQTFARALLDVCLWEFDEKQYTVHDYLEYNPTKSQAIATKEARKIAGTAGGLAKASKTPSKILAKHLAKPKQKSAPSPSPSPSFKIGDNKGDGGPAFPPPSSDPDLAGVSYRELEIAFREKTGIYPPTGGGIPTHKWVDGFKKLTEQHATPEEIAGTIDDMRERGLSISGPSSILNPLNIYRSKHPPDNRKKKTLELKTIIFPDGTTQEVMM